MWGGRSVTSPATCIYPGMTEEAREVLRTLVFSEKQIAATDGRWFSVRIMPYRTMEDVIGGVVITFADITAAKDAGDGTARGECTAQGSA